MALHQTVKTVTERIRNRSEDGRGRYLDRMNDAAGKGPHRAGLSCGNLAHGFAAASPGDKLALRQASRANIAIVSAYNDMLSAHQPLAEFPAIIKSAAREAGAIAQFAGGVPAMCDGVTQGEPGMELSLFSRDVIAMATAVALSHNMFDAAAYLGVCDKIVPGLAIGALSFGHLPAVFIPAGPMTSGLPNPEKSRIRQLFAEGKVGREDLLEAESQSYHGPGTCTFYGTANSNQMLMEIMGLHLPGASFVNPGTQLRDALTKAATKRLAELTALGNNYRPVGSVMDERAVVNGIVGLLATGGSTNHTLHLVAIAAAAGHRITWEDFSDLSGVIPSLTKIYPNGQADINHFTAAGGMGFLIRELRDAGLLHDDVKTVAGDGLDDYTKEPFLEGDELIWKDATKKSIDPAILRPVSEPFSSNGGLRVLDGSLGEAVIKISAVHPDHRVIEAPARLFFDQADLVTAFKAGELEQDFIAVLLYQGPKAIGMPELHRLTPTLGVLQDRGFKVALVTDGRMSGASGKVPAAIHVTPEAADGGPIARLRDGDMLRLDAETGQLDVLMDKDEFAARTPLDADLSAHQFGMGRDLFGAFRGSVSKATEGASIFSFS